MKLTLSPALLVLVFAVCYSPSLHAQTKRPFTIADEIGLTMFSAPDGPQKIHFSPNGEYVVVGAERGRLELNRVEDRLRFYRSQDIREFLAHSAGTRQPSPIWEITGVAKDGGNGDGVIQHVRWLADSSGVGFLERTNEGNLQLVLADVLRKKVEPLASVPRSIKNFDVRDRNHYVFTAPDPDEARKLEAKKDAEYYAPAVVGTGVQLDKLIFREDPRVKMASSPRACLWAATEGKPIEVKHEGAPIFPEGDDVALSPDGRTVVTTVHVSGVPSSWVALYPPPYPPAPYNRIHTGAQNVRQYAQIDVRTGSIQALTDAPLGEDSGWYWGPQGPASWSRDGQEVLVQGTFIRPKDNAPPRPCVAVVNVRSKDAICVEVLKGRTEEMVNGHTEIHREEGFHFITDVGFAEGNDKHVIVNFITPDNSQGSTIYRRRTEGTWQITNQVEGQPKAAANDLQLAVKQGLNEPPVLVASDKTTSRVIWDPNPQFKDLELGEATVYKWKDRNGHEWKGGLYKPVGYLPGKRYPLVIQTHGFPEEQFRPSGIFPTGFAARALAGAGIVVLQTVSAIGPTCPRVAPDEGPCTNEMFESAVRQLISDGLVDPNEIGIIGFSATCYHVMEELTAGSLPFKAALISDGTMKDYLQYLTFGPDNEAETMIGAKPFGEGLQQWFNRSPGFNLDKVNAALMVAGMGPASLLSMWQPYAVLHDLNKPVELVMLNTWEHVLTNPAVRIASQGGSVDWFRFWLQGYEDPDPAKADQYKRWRELKKLQDENDKKAVSASAASN